MAVRSAGMRGWGGLGLVCLMAVVAGMGAPDAHAGCRRDAFRVVLDVGHTPQAFGATSATGLEEYDFNRRLADATRAALLEEGFRRATVMLTEGRGRRQLLARGTRAGAMKADLLLSLHHDAVPDDGLTPWEVKGKPQHYSDAARGFSVFVSSLNPAFAASQDAAVMIGEALRAAGRPVAHHHAGPPEGRPWIDEERGVYRYDELIVLGTATMPAVLVEAGVIVHREEEQEVLTPAFRALTARALASAVARFCDSR
jgi:N-acetylmuramoyl-L-alanine amidase